MTDKDKKPPGAALCWICRSKEPNSGEHKTKRSDLAAVLGSPSQDRPFYFHDLERRNKPPVKSLDAKILKATARTRWVRANRIFRHDTRRQMIDVHPFFLKLFGCMLCEANANEHDVPIDIAPFSDAIMTGCPHPEVHLQFGKCDGTVGQSNLHCWKTEHGSVLAGWLISWIASPSVRCLPRRGGGRIAPIYRIHGRTRAPSVSR